MYDRYLSQRSDRVALQARGSPLPPKPFVETGLDPAGQYFTCPQGLQPGNIVAKPMDDFRYQYTGNVLSCLASDEGTVFCLYNTVSGEYVPMLDDNGSPVPKPRACPSASR